jgi:hypothetical protein
MIGRSILYSFFGLCIGFCAVIVIFQNGTDSGLLLIGSMVGLCVGLLLSLWINRLYASGTFLGQEYTFARYHGPAFYGWATAFGIGLFCAVLVLGLLSSFFQIQLGEVFNAVILMIFGCASLFVFKMWFPK